MFDAVDHVKKINCDQISIILQGQLMCICKTCNTYSEMQLNDSRTVDRQ